MLGQKSKNKKWLAYFMLFIVLFIWGASPPLNALLNEDYSPAFRFSIVSLISAIGITVICCKKLKLLNLDYIKTAVPTGSFLAIASLLQKIGLLYTTPTRYAFLENLSCVVVPILLFIATKKKPSILTVLSCLLCLLGSFVLTGMISGQEGGFGIGELLCSLAGLLYGINIAYTGIRIKKFDTSLYLFVQLWTGFFVSLFSALLLSVIKYNGAPIEAIRFSFYGPYILLIVALALISNVLCWVLRTYAMKFVNPTVVSVIMPFSAVVTGGISLMWGMDTFSLEFLFGGLISLVAIILSGIADAKDAEQKKSK